MARFKVGARRKAGDTVKSQGRVAPPMPRRRGKKKGASPAAEDLGVAVLVDGDNIPPVLLGPLLARTDGPVTERRIWRNWRSTRDSQDWDAVSKELGFERVDRYNTRKEGKNASDIALAVGAMDLYHHGYRRFVLVSGDTDFVPLVERLRRGGAKVTIVGHHKDPGLLEQVSDEYIAGNALARNAPSRGSGGGRSSSRSSRSGGRKASGGSAKGGGKGGTKGGAKGGKGKDSGPTKRQEKALKAALFDALDACIAEGRADDEGYVSVDTLGKMVHAKNKDFRLTAFGYPARMSLSDAYRSFKDAFEVHSMTAKGGKRKRYRVRPR